MQSSSQSARDSVSTSRKESDDKIESSELNKFNNSEADFVQNLVDSLVIKCSYEPYLCFDVKKRSEKSSSCDETHKIPSAIAVRNITLRPDDFFRFGAYPYFAEEIVGMFVRVKLCVKRSGVQTEQVSQQDGAFSYIWARIVGCVTGEELYRVEQGSNDTVYDTQNLLYNVPGTLRRRMLDGTREGVYWWHNRKYELYLILEHSVGELLNSSMSNAIATIGGKKITESGVLKGAPIILVSLRQLATQWEPSQEEIDSYFQMFNSRKQISPFFEQVISLLELSKTKQQINLSSASQDTLENKLRVNCIDLLSKEFKAGFCTDRSQSPANGDVTVQSAARVGRRDSKSTVERLARVMVDFSSYQPLPGSSASLRDNERAFEHVLEDLKSRIRDEMCTVAHTFRSNYERNVISRKLTPEDSTKIIVANSKLKRLLGNTILSHTVLTNQQLWTDAEREANRRKEERQQNIALRVAKEAEAAKKVSQGGAKTMVRASVGVGDVYHMCAAEDPAVLLGEDKEKFTDPMVRAHTFPLMSSRKESDETANPTPVLPTESLNIEAQRLLNYGTDDVSKDEQVAFYRYVSTAMHTSDDKRMIALTEQNRKENTNVQLVGERFLRERQEREGGGAKGDHVLEEGMWIVDEKKRRQVCEEAELEKKLGDTPVNNKAAQNIPKGTAVPRILSDEEKTAIMLTEAKKLRRSQLTRLVSRSDAAEVPVKADEGSPLLAIEVDISRINQECELDELLDMARQTVAKA